MNNFHFITPEEAVALDVKEGTSLEEYKKMASEDSEYCEICDTEKTWHLAGTGMCFSCTTGEADASNDYEIKE